MAETTETLFPMRKFFAPEFVFGVGALDLAGRYARNLGASRVFLVSDPGVREAGWVRDVEASLEAEELPWVLFDQVSPNPQMEEVEAGTRAFEEHRCDMICAVGGGSPIDCAKAVSVLSTNGGNIRDYLGVDQVPQPGCPLLMIPTTAGSAAEVSQFAILSDPRARRKCGIISKLIVPDVALVDPRTPCSLDTHQAAGGAMDTLTHAVEAYVSNAHSPVTDPLALEAVRLVGAHFEEGIAHPARPEHRGHLLKASLLSGLAFSNASLGLVHAMAHALGGMLDSIHGDSNALLLDGVVRFNLSSATSRYARVAEALGVSPEGLIPRLRELRGLAGLGEGIASLGATEAIIPDLVARAMADPCLVTNPRQPRPDEVAQLFREAL